MSEVVTREWSFGECEHEGDLEEYTGDLCRSGAKILSTEINYEAEIGHVTFSVPKDKVADFSEKFKKTTSYYFV